MMVLPIAQSLHDGRTLRHVPLRLSVFIEAPRGPIDRVLARQPLPRALAAHGWLHLLRIDPDFPVVERWHEGRWVTAAEGAFDPALLDEAATEPAALAG